MNTHCIGTLSLVALLLSGCATVETASNVREGSPRFFAGSSLDVAAITENREALERFGAYGMRPPKYPVADLPLSIAADVALLPFAVNYSIGEPLLVLLSGE